MKMQKLLMIFFVLVSMVLIQRTEASGKGEKNFFQKLDEVAKNPEKLGEFFKETGLNPNSCLPVEYAVFHHNVMNGIELPHTILSWVIFVASNNMTEARMLGEDITDEIRNYKRLLSEMLKHIDDNDSRLNYYEKAFGEKCKEYCTNNRQLADKKNKNEQERRELARSNVGLLEQSDCALHRIFQERLQNRNKK